MALTLAEYKAVVKHALGGEPDAIYTDAGTTKEQIVNEALAHLYDMHPWSWRRAKDDLGFTQSQEYVTLPTDFGELLALGMNDNTIDSIEPTTLAQIELFRASNITTTNRYYYALVQPTQANVTSLMGNPRLEVWPTPGATDSDALYCIYRRKPVVLDDDTDVPNIPQAFERLLVKLCRAYALEHEDEREDAIDGIEASSLVERLKDADARTQYNFGFTTGGAMDEVQTHGRIPFSSISGPS